MKRIPRALVFGLSGVLLILAGCSDQTASHLENGESNTQIFEVEYQDLHAQRGRQPAYLELATGFTSETNLEAIRAPWPFALLSIGHTSASYQNYGGSPYFHHGLDIRGDAGTSVLASVGGRVVNVENYGPGPAYWEVAILDDNGFVWQYHHVDRSTIPQAVLDAFKNEGRIEAGDKVGEIYYWPVTTFGERFHHVHLNILGAEKKFVNPFLFLEPLPDLSAPKILDFGLTQNGLRVEGNEVSGTYSMFAKVHDLILHQKFVVPANSMEVSIDGAPAFSVWNFNDGLPGGASEEQFVSNYYVPSLTCGNYTCRDLNINLGFTKTGNRGFPSQSGAHTATLTAKDAFGNETTHTYTWKVK